MGGKPCQVATKAARAGRGATNQSLKTKGPTTMPTKRADEKDLNPKPKPRLRRMPPGGPWTRWQARIVAWGGPWWSVPALGLQGKKGYRV